MIVFDPKQFMSTSLSAKLPLHKIREVKLVAMMSNTLGMVLRKLTEVNQR